MLKPWLQNSMSTSMNYSKRKFSVLSRVTSSSGELSTWFRVNSLFQIETSSIGKNEKVTEHYYLAWFHLIATESPSLYRNLWQHYQWKSINSTSNTKSQFFGTSPGKPLLPYACWDGINILARSPMDNWLIPSSNPGITCSVNNLNRNGFFLFLDFWLSYIKWIK